MDGDVQRIREALDRLERCHGADVMPENAGRPAGTVGPVTYAAYAAYFRPWVDKIASSTSKIAAERAKRAAASLKYAETSPRDIISAFSANKSLNAAPCAIPGCCTWRGAIASSYCAVHNAVAARSSVYSTTPQTLADLARRSDFKCACCGDPLDVRDLVPPETNEEDGERVRGRPWVVHHQHKPAEDDGFDQTFGTGKQRGGPEHIEALLCHDCNILEGVACGDVLHDHFRDPASLVRILRFLTGVDRGGRFTAIWPDEDMLRRIHRTGFKARVGDAKRRTAFTRLANARAWAHAQLDADGDGGLDIRADTSLSLLEASIIRSAEHAAGSLLESLAAARAVQRMKELPHRRRAARRVLHILRELGVDEDVRADVAGSRPPPSSLTVLPPKTPMAASKSTPDKENVIASDEADKEVAVRFTLPPKTPMRVLQRRSPLHSPPPSPLVSPSNPSETAPRRRVSPKKIPAYLLTRKSGNVIDDSSDEDDDN